MKVLILEKVFAGLLLSGIVTHGLLRMWVFFQWGSVRPPIRNTADMLNTRFSNKESKFVENWKGKGSFRVHTLLAFTGAIKVHGILSPLRLSQKCLGVRCSEVFPSPLSS